MTPPNSRKKRRAGLNRRARTRDAASGGALASPGRPILRFVCFFAAAVGGFYVFTALPLFSERISPSFLTVNARAAAACLRGGGLSSIADGPYLTTNGFSIEIARGCDAVEPIVLFVAAVLAFPVGAKRKAPGLLIGVACLLAANLLRIISLALTGLYWPAAFEAMHVDVWQAIFIGLALVLWVLWARRAFSMLTVPPADDHALAAS